MRSAIRAVVNTTVGGLAGYVGADWGGSLWWSVAFALGVVAFSLWCFWDGATA